MELIFGVVADAANKGEGDKLNILGIFHELQSPQLPCTHPMLALAMEFRASPGDKGKTFQIRVPLLDPDGKELVGVEIEMGLAPQHPLLEPIVPIALNLPGLSFHKAGSHRFEIHVDGEFKGAIPLNVGLMKKQP